MEGKVIKLNFIGTILIIIVIIALIVSGVVFTVKNNNKNNENQNSEENGNTVSNLNEDDINIENTNIDDNSKKKNVIDEDKEYIQKVIVNGNEQDVTMKICKGTFGYSIKYDVNSFFVEKDKDGVDVFNSLYSNTIYMNISLEKGDFDELAQKLINENGAIELEINNIRTIKTTQAKTDENIVTYYISNSDQDYFVVSTHCGTGFENIINPIMDVMIDSFEIISED